MFLVLVGGPSGTGTSGTGAGPPAACGSRARDLVAILPPALPTDSLEVISPPAPVCARSSRRSLWTILLASAASKTVLSTILSPIQAVATLPGTSGGEFEEERGVVGDTELPAHAIDVEVEHDNAEGDAGNRASMKASM